MKLKHRSMLPEKIAPSGQPGGAKVVFSTPHGQGKQPGHRQGKHHPKTGVAKPTQTNTTVADKPKTVRHMLRHGHTGASIPKRMTAGQVLHHSGQHHGGSSQSPYSRLGTQMRQPGQPEKAGQADIGGGLSAGMHNMTQARLAPYGTPKRFIQLRMTKKSDGGRY